ncbi:MAG: TldD/PmbA family protein [Proteobacteria bacterium]|nr:TldD/PmbA family protein [Pseudomonadota bacterium]MBQ4358846.1 TldD/PmbA family protein [Pseudomonadota bacterium]
MNWTRRDFLSTSALAAASLPLIGCATSKPQTKDTPMANEIAVPACNDYFCSKFGVTDEMIDKVLAKTLSKGGQWGELFFEHKSSGSVNLLDGKVASGSASISLGMGARCVVDDQVGYAFTESLTLEDMMRAAEAAAAIAPNVDAGPVNPRKDAEFKTWYDTNYTWDSLDISRAVAMIQSIDAKTRAKDSSIVQVSVGLSWNQRVIMVSTSDGIRATDSQPYFVLRLSIVMERNGEKQSNGGSIAGLDTFDSITEDKIATLIDEAVADTQILFEAVKPKGGEWPIVLGAGASGILLHEAIGHGMEADFNRKEASIFATKMNQRVASDEVTIGDSGLIRGSRGALNVDDEGTPTQDTTLVENGILKSYMHDKISAKHYGVAPTGSGRRDSYKWAPLPRMRVTYMANGTHEVDELVKNIKYGIFCKKYTNGQVLIGPGDYTFYVKNGFLIEDGKITAPIKDVNIIGNGPDTLSKITMVANDQKFDNGGWTCGKDGQSMPVSLGMPSVLVSAITVGGI